MVLLDCGFGLGVEPSQLCSALKASLVDTVYIGYRGTSCCALGHWEEESLSTEMIIDEEFRSQQLSKFRRMHAFIPGPQA